MAIVRLRRACRAVTLLPRLTPKLLSMLVAAALGLLAAEGANAAAADDNEERRAAVVYRHFV